MPIVQSLETSNEIEINKMKSEDYTSFNDIKLLIYYIDNEGNFQKILKILSKTNYQLFLDEVSDLSYQFSNFMNFLDKKLEVMKKYEIIPIEVTLNNFIDFDIIEEASINPFNLTDADKFVSHFAPVFMIGMGFGFGIGFRRMPVMKRIAGNLFSVGVIGLGGIVCLDVEDWSIYYQYTFTYPLLLHILSGFIGIMMFAFDNIYPPENGPPISIYSNFIAIGMAGLAIGFKIPQI
jgi:hypothetical protein